MKRRSGILLASVLSLLLLASSSSVKTGIKFDGLTVAKAKELSNVSGKLIFIDCYTVWCGPCKRMAATSFKDETVGRVFNQKFINLKVEMEKDADGPELARKYGVKAYPTLLVIDSKGNLVKQVIGMQSRDGLLNLARSVE